MLIFAFIPQTNGFFPFKFSTAARAQRNSMSFHYRVPPPPLPQSAHILLNSEICVFAKSTPWKVSWPLKKVCRTGDLQINGINFIPATLSKDSLFYHLAMDFRKTAYSCIQSDMRSSFIWLYLSSTPSQRLKWGYNWLCSQKWSRKCWLRSYNGEKEKGCEDWIGALSTGQGRVLYSSERDLHKEELTRTFRPLRSNMTWQRPDVGDKGNINKKTNV